MNMGMEEEEYREKMDRLMRKSSHYSVSDEQLAADLANVPYSGLLGGEIERAEAYLRELQQAREALRAIADCRYQVMGDTLSNMAALKQIAREALGGGS